MAFDPVVNLLIPLLTAAIGVWVGQLVKWEYEKKKLRFEERKKFIQNIREAVASEEFNRIDFMETVFYSQIRPYLSKNVLIDFEGETGEIKVSKKDRLRITSYLLMLDDIQRIEREWGLL